jgi:NitT/TauT family transport system permease protein
MPMTSTEITAGTVPSAESGRHIADRHTRSGPRRATFTRTALARLVVPAAGIFWTMAAGITLVWPDQFPWYSTVRVGLGTGAIGVLILLAALIGLVQPTIGTRLRRVGPWLLVLGMLALAWQLTTAKLALLPRLYFPPPQAIVDGFEDDWALLLESLAYSLRLLALGYAIGATVGFCSGLAMGWSKAVNYWLHPVLRVIGPVPATAWLPIVFVVLPTSFTASIFLLALATWFPVAILTWSGVAGVSRTYYDVARTLGATDRFLIWKVAVPAALPSVFVGLFMGLGASFVTLLVAEMLGVKAGLGWYIQWVQGWAEYPKMYAALLIMIVLFSGLITLLFRVRNRVLAWQKGLVRW